MTVSQSVISRLKISSMSSLLPKINKTSLLLCVLVACIVIVVSGCKTNHDEELSVEEKFRYADKLKAEGKYDEAFRIYDKYARSGQPWALFQCGLSHLLGRGTEKNTSVGLEYLTRASEKGVIMATYQLGIFYTNINSDYYDCGKAIKYMNSAAAEEYRDAVADLGRFYLYGICVDKNYDTALQYLNKCSDYGKCMSQLGYAYYNGWGVPVEKKRAFQLTQKASELGRPEAQLLLGGFYISGTVVPRNITLAKYWLRKSFEGGLKDAGEILKLLESDEKKFGE